MGEEGLINDSGLTDRVSLLTGCCSWPSIPSQTALLFGLPFRSSHWRKHTHTQNTHVSRCFYCCNQSALLFKKQ